MDFLYRLCRFVTVILRQSKAEFNVYKKLACAGNTGFLLHSTFRYDMMKKIYLSYVLAVLFFIISCFLKANEKMIFEGLAILFLLGEEIGNLLSKKQTNKITPFIDFFLAICFFLLKEGALFFIYKGIEQGIHLLFKKQFENEKMSNVDKSSFLKSSKIGQKRFFFVFFLLSSIFLFLLLDKEKKTLFLFLLTILLLLKQNRLESILITLYQISLQKIKQKQILFHKEDLFEKINLCDEVVLTKTGVLTYGKLEITKIIPVYQTKEEIFKYATLLEKKSRHPIAYAFHGKYRDEEEHEISFISEMKGKGIRGVIDGMEVVHGSGTLFEELNIKYPRVEFLHPTTMIAIDGTYVGTFVFKDELKENLEFLFPLLKEEGITKSVLLSSSSKEQIKKIASHLSITESYASLTLEDKLAFLKNEKRYHHILYVDDLYQSNDFMKVADVTVSLSPNKDCDIELVNGDITHILFLKKEAKQLTQLKNRICTFYFLLLFIDLILAFLNYKNVIYMSILFFAFEVFIFYLLKSHKKNL